MASSASTKSVTDSSPRDVTRKVNSWALSSQKISENRRDFGGVCASSSPTKRGSMRKIPTVFERDEETQRRFVKNEVNPAAKWVLDGEGIATRKYDGTCVMFDGVAWWARREVKPGKTAPANFLPI